ncbi:LOW QUALITY PROTEIN: transcription factor Adf-1-like, partial [Hyalella azteca]|uniref:LOW QUALITY PROTEIN: transcription factor Adf-1-like n=1 Tax=Hyalella azteca TaxID=294128 RepID=A0A979FXA2_HYAAZ
MDVEALICSIQAVPAIWDASHPKHSDRQYINDSWSQICDALGIPESVARKKYNSLRDHSRTELKKVPHVKSGDPGLLPEEYTSIWPFFKMMFFLKDQMLGRKISGNL